MDPRSRSRRSSSSSSTNPSQFPRIKSLGISSREELSSSSNTSQEGELPPASERRSFRYQRTGTSGSLFNIEGFELEEEEFLISGGDPTRFGPQVNNGDGDFAQNEYELRKDSIKEEDEEELASNAFLNPEETKKTAVISWDSLERKGQGDRDQ
jgi:hypothetical protein